MVFFGIYKITNLLNGKMYIGKHRTDNLDDGYMGSGIHITRSVKKYGKENFRKEWLMFCEDEEEMNYMEMVYVDQTWVDRSDTYNLTVGGQGGAINKGKKFSEEIRKRMSDAQKKKYEDGYVHPMTGKHHSEDTKHKLSESMKERHPWNKGKRGIYSEETRKQKSLHSIGTTAGEKNGMFGVHRYGCANPNFGHKWTEEQRKRQSEKLKAAKQRRQNRVQ